MILPEGATRFTVDDPSSFGRLDTDDFPGMERIELVLQLTGQLDHARLAGGFKLGILPHLVLRTPGAVDALFDRGEADLALQPDKVIRGNEQPLVSRNLCLLTVPVEFGLPGVFHV